MKYLLLTIAIAGMFVLGVQAEDDDVKKPAKPDQPVELGSVHWLRDLDEAISNSKQEQKPIAILFQEVPG